MAESTLELQQQLRQTLLEKGYKESNIDEFIAKDPEFNMGTGLEKIEPIKPAFAQAPQARQMGQPAPQAPVSGFVQPMAQTDYQSTNTRGNISQQFGNPNARLYGRDAQGRPNINRGVDIPLAKGTPQSAPSQGNWVVKSVRTGSYNSGWGNSVIIKNTETGETIRRSHFDKVLVKPGQKVSGKVLGTTGRTGKTTGYHQDIEYTLPNGKLADYTKSPYY